jgi:hypothetical protein
LIRFCLEKPLSHSAVLTGITITLFHKLLKPGHLIDHYGVVPANIQTSNKDLFGIISLMVSRAWSPPSPNKRLIPSPHLLVLATNERFLPAGGIFRAILASESHWLQPVLVLTVHWWPTPAGVGRVLFIPLARHVFSFSKRFWDGLFFL